LWFTKYISGRKAFPEKLQNTMKEYEMLATVAATAQRCLTSLGQMAITRAPSEQDTRSLWIAIYEALGGTEEWREEHVRCALIDRETGRALVFRAVDDDDVSISHRRRNARGDLEELAAWRLTLDDRGVRNVTMGEAPARVASVKALADLIWIFHRLAVEDRASVLRS
jgi:hypothetical protein